MNAHEIIKCSRCGIALIKEQVVDGKLIKRFQPFYSEKTIQLDNGSYTRIPICKTCDNK